MSQIMFSIVVVCLNAGDKLKATIESIRNQTYSNYEIIVKDGLSEDGSIEALPSDHRIKVFREKDTGIYQAMNRAAEHVTGDYVYFLNCGDVFYDEHVLQKVDGQISRYKKTGQAHIFYGDIFERLTGEMVSSNPRMDAFGCYRNVPCHQACFYELLLIKEKEFEPEYRVRADYEHFLWCFFKGNAAAVYMPFPVADYEGGGFSETKENRKNSQTEHRIIVRKYMSGAQVFKYRMIMLVTLSGFRTWLAENKTTAHVYNKVKDILYGRKRGLK